MSQGKGDKDRTSDKKAYDENYDLIDFSRPSGDNTTVTVKYTLKPIPVPEEEGEGTAMALEIEQWTNEGGALKDGNGK